MSLICGFVGVEILAASVSGGGGGEGVGGTVATMPRHSWTFGRGLNMVVPMHTCIRPFVHE
jgi:hypothetical protein